MQQFIVKIQQFISYLWSKRSELQSMDERDMLLAKVVMDIHRQRTHTAFVFVPLFSLKQIHPINRKNSLNQTRKRIDIIKAKKEALLKKRHISRDDLARYLPSVSAIKAVKEKDNAYIAYEGNGRLVALQSVFTRDDGVSIEIEEYFFTDPAKILRRMNSIRELHGLFPEEKQ